MKRKKWLHTISKPRIIFIYVSSINMFNKSKHGMQMRRNNQNDQEVKCMAMYIDSIYFYDYLNIKLKRFFFLNFFFFFNLIVIFSLKPKQITRIQTICTAFFYLYSTYKVKPNSRDPHKYLICK